MLTTPSARRAADELNMAPSEIGLADGHKLHALAQSLRLNSGEVVMLVGRAPKVGTELYLGVSVLGPQLIPMT